MTHGTGSSSIVAAMSEQSPDCFTVSGENELNGCQPIEVVRVGEQRLGHMSDEEREDAIQRAGTAMQAWYSRYQSTGDARSLDMAYRLLSIEKQLIEGRSADAVRRLELERGIA